MSDNFLVPIDQERERLHLEVQRRAVETVADVIGVLVRGGNAWIEVGQGREQSERDNEATQRRIAELDAGTRDYLGRLGGDLSKTKEKTEQLRLLLDYAAGSAKDVPPAIAEGVCMALDNLTRGA